MRTRYPPNPTKSDKPQSRRQNVRPTAAHRRPKGTPAKGKAVPVRYHRWLKNPRRSGQTRKPPGSAGSIAGWSTGTARPGRV